MCRPQDHSPRGLQGRWSTIKGASTVVTSLRPAANTPAAAAAAAAPPPPRRRRAEVAAGAFIWENDQGGVTPAVRQLLTFAEIQRHHEEAALRASPRPGTSPAAAAAGGDAAGGAPRPGTSPVAVGGGHR